MLVAGLGALPLLGVARSWRELVARSGLAYLVGIAIVGIVAAHLALVRVSFGWVALTLVAALSAVAGAWHLRGTERPAWQRPGWVSLAGIALIAAVLAEYARAFAVAPLDEYDAWAIWALKGHALYTFGWADPAVFAGSEYRFANLDYPLLLPAIEAVDFHAMGAFDTRLLHLQFLLFLVAGLAALCALLRDRVPPIALWPSLLAIALAPAVFDQLLTAYADVPLALVFAVGVAAAGRWLVAGDRWSLAVAVVCFGAALLTKNEGSLFVAGAFFGLMLVARGRRRSVAIAAAATALVLVPWRIWVWIYELHDINYSLLDSFDFDYISGRLGVGPIAFRTLGGEMVDPMKWGLLAWLFVAVLAAALVRRFYALTLFAVVWAGLSWLGLSWIYVITRFEYSSYLGSTQDRVVASIVLGGAALTPLVASEVWSSRDRLARDRPQSGDG
jgi:hypothetical protein